MLHPMINSGFPGYAPPRLAASSDAGSPIPWLLHWNNKWSMGATLPDPSVKVLRGNFVSDGGNRRMPWSPPRSSSIGGGTRFSYCMDNASRQPMEVQESTFESGWLRDCSLSLDSEHNHFFPAEQDALEISTSPGHFLRPTRAGDTVYGPQVKPKDHVNQSDNASFRARHHSSGSHHLKKEHTRHHTHYRHESASQRRHEIHRRGVQHRPKSSHATHGRQSHSNSLLMQPYDSSDDDEHATNSKRNGPLSLDMLAAGLWHEMEKAHASAAKAARQSRSASPHRPLSRRKPQVEAVNVIRNNYIKEEAPIPFWEESFV